MSIQNTIKSALESYERFPQTKEIRLQVLQGNSTYIKGCQQVLQGIFRDKLCSPTQKLLAMKFLKDLVETFNDDFISSIQINILPILEQIAIYKLEEKSEDRGKTYFQVAPNLPVSQEIQSIGNSYLRLCLENIWVWSKWFPVDPESYKISIFKITMYRLLNLGVKFPVLFYYDYYDVSSHMPETLMFQTPIEMLQELREVIKMETSKTLSISAKKIQKSLYKTVKMPGGKGTVTSNNSYADYLQKLVDTIRKRKSDLGHHETEKHRKATVRFDLHTEQDNISQKVQQSVEASPMNAKKLEQPDFVKVSEQPSNQENSFQAKLSQHLQDKGNIQTQIFQEEYNRFQIEKQLSANTTEKARLLEGLKNYKDQIQQLQQEIRDKEQRYQEQIQQIKSENQGKKTNDLKDENQDEIRELKRNIARKDAQIQRLQSELERQKSVLDQHQKSLDTHLKSKSDLEDQLYQHLHEKEDIDNQNQHLQSTINRQAKQIQSLQEQIHSVMDQLKAAKLQHQKSYVSTSEQIQRLQNELVAEIHEKTMIQDQMRNLCTENDLLKQELETNKQSLKRLEQMNLKNGKEKTDLVKQLENSKNEVQVLKTQITSGFSQTKFNKTGMAWSQPNNQLFKSTLPKFQSPKSVNSSRTNFNQNLIPYSLDQFGVNPNLVDYRFKMSSLKEKSILYLDEFLKIGVISVLTQSTLNIQLYFSSEQKDNTVKDFQIQYIYSNQYYNVEITPGTLEKDFTKDQQQRQDIFVTPLNNVFPLIVASFKHRISSNIKFQKQIVLPITVNKFFEYQQLDPNKFPSEGFPLKSERFQFDSRYPSLIQALPNFVQLDQGDQDELIYSQFIFNRQFMTMRVSKQEQQIQIELDSGNQDDLGRFVVQSLMAILKQS